jgi:hypothetical protein
MNMRFPANSDRSIIVTRKYTWIYSLLFFGGSLISFISSAPARACTPVVYAFRHAEDLPSDIFPTGLKPVGRQHADLYPSMVKAFGAAHDYCPVGFVYSVYNINPGPPPAPGTNNPLQTAQPLAIAACGNLAGSPVAPCSGLGFQPRTGLQPLTGLTFSDQKLSEYLGLKECAAKDEVSDLGSQFQREMAYTAATFNFSSAVFWTSQGLHDLGQAIAPGTDIPCKIPGSTPPPRNAAYVFEYNRNTGDYEAIAPPDKYVQCFNVKPLSDPPMLSSTKYWCGKATNGALPDTLGDKPLQADLYLLQGKICDTSDLKDKTLYGGYYGYCELP